jgi:hypothetical protein
MVAGLSADPSRIRQIEDYAQRNVPAGARKPFAGAVAAIRQNQHIATVVLPELDRFIAAGRLTRAAHREVRPH